jgi:hypothetical protein
VVSVLSGVLFEHFESLTKEQNDPNSNPAQPQEEESSVNKLKELLGGQLQIQYDSIDQYKEIWMQYLLYYLYSNIIRNRSYFTKNVLNRALAIKHLKLEDQSDDEIPQNIQPKRFSAVSNEVQLVLDEESKCLKFKSQEKHGDIIRSMSSGDIVLLIGSDHTTDFLYEVNDAISNNQEELFQETLQAQFDRLVDIIKQLDQKNQKAATLLLGFVQKWTR